jgi:uncharacterized protein (DUF2141 family)
MENIKSEEGTIYLALYDSKEKLFKKNDSISKGIKVEKTGAVTVKMEDVSFGKYALAIYHDLNNNGKLDQNFFGIPTEPYAFARKLPTKWRAPLFEELTIDFSEDNQTVSTALKTWWEY